MASETEMSPVERLVLDVMGYRRLEDYMRGEKPAEQKWEEFFSDTWLANPVYFRPAMERKRRRFPFVPYPTLLDHGHSRGDLPRDHSYNLTNVFVFLGANPDDVMGMRDDLYRELFPDATLWDNIGSLGSRDNFSWKYWSLHEREVAEIDLGQINNKGVQRGKFDVNVAMPTALAERVDSVARRYGAMCARIVHEEKEAAREAVRRHMEGK